MRSKTGWESFVGIFSEAKSESLRAERLRAATIDDKLQDLIAKSDVIVKLLQGQLDLLNGQKSKVEANLAGTLTDREADQLWRLVHIETCRIKARRRSIERNQARLALLTERQAA